MEDLHKIRLYPEKTEKPGTSDNLVIEIDGQKMKGVTEFSYKIKPGEIPMVEIHMVANVSIDAHAAVRKSVDNGLDGVSY